ncbi:MAG: glycosyltransferase family 2 protein [Chloroflexota bacterium]|nr:MAG: glycosyltransferase family 2 protein [Chloroflexota bacterium]
MNDLRSRAGIVIPVFNQLFFTRVCLLALEQVRGGAEVVVVDNGSTDGSAEFLAGWHDPEAGRRWLPQPENLGFAAGCNAGAAASDREFVVFLNNDTFPLEGWLSELLVPFEEDPAVKVTGSRLLYPSGRIQHAGVAFNALGPHHIFVGLPGSFPPALVRRDYQVVTGAALAIRHHEFDRLGGFDTGYFNSFEDVDLCLSVRRDGGRVVYVPTSVAYHFESMTEGRLDPSDMRNYQLFMDRWGSVFARDIDELLEQARSEGHDLSDRAPSRREVVDQQRRVEELARRLDQLRLALRIRPRRAALRAGNALRRLVRRRR